MRIDETMPRSRSGDDEKPAFSWTTPFKRRYDDAWRASVLAAQDSVEPKIPEASATRLLAAKRGHAPLCT